MHVKLFVCSFQCLFVNTKQNWEILLEDLREGNVMGFFQQRECVFF